MFFACGKHQFLEKNIKDDVLARRPFDCCFMCGCVLIACGLCMGRRQPACPYTHAVAKEKGPIQRRSRDWTWIAAVYGYVFIRRLMHRHIQTWNRTTSNESKVPGGQTLNRCEDWLDQFHRGKGPLKYWKVAALLLHNAQSSLSNGNMICEH